MSYTWAQFKAAVDGLLLTDSDRAGTETGKALKVKLGVKKLQDVIDKYRAGHQDIFEGSDFTQVGFASQGTIPDSSADHSCEPRDCFILRKVSVAASTAADATDDELTVTAHGITATSDDPSLAEIEVGRFRTTGTMYGGVEAGRSYYLRVVDADTLTLHTTAQDAIDGTNLVDITGDATGTVTLDWGIKRIPVTDVDWDRRYELEHKVICLDREGYVSFDPNGVYFWVFPIIPVGEDDDGYTWSFEFNWDGNKIEWEDSDLTPFDDEAVEYVAEYASEWFKRHVDQDLQQAEASMKAAKSLRSSIYLKAKRQREQR